MGGTSTGGMAAATRDALPLIPCIKSHACNKSSLFSFTQPNIELTLCVALCMVVGGWTSKSGSEAISSATNLYSFSALSTSFPQACRQLIFNAILEDGLIIPRFILLFPNIAFHIRKAAYPAVFPVCRFQMITHRYRRCHIRTGVNRKRGLRASNCNHRWRSLIHCHLRC